MLSLRAIDVIFWNWSKGRVKGSSIYWDPTILNGLHFANITWLATQVLSNTHMRLFIALKRLFPIYISVLSVFLFTHIEHMGERPISQLSVSATLSLVRRTCHYPSCSNTTTLYQLIWLCETVFTLLFHFYLTKNSSQLRTRLPYPATSGAERRTRYSWVNSPAGIANLLVCMSPYCVF